MCTALINALRTGDRGLHIYMCILVCSFQLSSYRKPVFTTGCIVLVYGSPVIDPITLENVLSTDTAVVGAIFLFFLARFSFRQTKFVCIYMALLLAQCTMSKLFMVYFHFEQHPEIV